ncbi:MAG: tRNA (adenosine(37)-N6)-threonylcarbamoyltransferase complex transferase subunit TsaD [Bacteroidia bacterium]|nr:tRNA (adenosine(37)-N6)-threonylcarbamoyltransferase complex transferase subunit TsaD [Bacteroidia bacterium]
MSIIILGIESSCDDTCAAIIRDGILLSNIIAGQEIHKQYGGVVPELASRAHQQNIIPVVDVAIRSAGISKSDIKAVAFTRGPGLMGALLVGASFAKGFALSMNIPLIAVNHLHGHILVHFIKEKENNAQQPEFPFLCLLVSGGHTQLIVVRGFLHFEIIGTTIDDAAGEAYDKCAKIIGLDYPGGPAIDKYAKNGDEKKFTFSIPSVRGLNFSFSGLKTNFLYFVRDRLKQDKNFVVSSRDNLCASIQYTINKILCQKLQKAVEQTGIKEVAIAGGVAANSALRSSLKILSAKNDWNLYLPKPMFTTDNAAMIAITGYYSYLNKKFDSLEITPVAKYFTL